MAAKPPSVVALPVEWWDPHLMAPLLQGWAERQLCPLRRHRSLLHHQRHHLDPPLCRNLLADHHGQVVPAQPPRLGGSPFVPQPVFWEVWPHIPHPGGSPRTPLPSVSIGGKGIACAFGCQAIVDTGTSLLAVPGRVLRVILSILGASSSGEVRPQRTAQGLWGPAGMPSWTPGLLPIAPRGTWSFLGWLLTPTCRWVSP